MTTPKAIMALAASALMLCGCANAPKGPLFMMPLAATEAGYSAASGSAVYESRGVKVTLRQVREAEPYGPGDTARWMQKRGYLLVALSIENGSDEKVMYDPVHTSLVNDALDYLKPLDFTDIYDDARSSKDTDADALMEEIRGVFYDLAVTLAPGENTSRLLVFRPFTKTAAKAELRLREIYVGTGTISLSFQFSLEEA